MAYARRTCHKCGMIKPVNYMTKTTVQKKTGYASDKVTGLTVLGFIGGNKASQRRVNRRLFANNKRGYVRNKEVWQCDAGECNYTVDEIRRGLVPKQAAPEQEPLSDGAAIAVLGVVAAICYGLWKGFWWVWDGIVAFFA